MLDKGFGQCYFINSYTTDGSGINHREYNHVRADRLGKSLDECRLFFNSLVKLLVLRAKRVVLKQLYWLRKKLKYDIN